MFAIQIQTLCENSLSIKKHLFLWISELVFQTKYMQFCINSIFINTILFHQKKNKPSLIENNARVKPRPIEKL